MNTDTQRDNICESKTVGRGNINYNNNNAEYNVTNCNIHNRYSRRFSSTYTPMLPSTFDMPLTPEEDELKQINIDNYSHLALSYSNALFGSNAISHSMPFPPTPPSPPENLPFDPSPILTADEFNSIFESFDVVYEDKRAEWTNYTYNHQHEFNDYGDMDELNLDNNNKNPDYGCIYDDECANNNNVHDHLALILGDLSIDR
ncbi:6336_t:CDS:1 [Paraglomus brasilianum]|uniref:6336_t:CDS:1 n=1 Tax=Paraglomus brasilianum TaxID=144538 RepID=A0A9N8WJB9_9GLOM|nr:6336_t:CDS:1 [Paraglomus brasilianum]